MARQFNCCERSVIIKIPTMSCNTVLCRMATKYNTAQPQFDFDLLPNLKTHTIILEGIVGADQLYTLDLTKIVI